MFSEGAAPGHQHYKAKRASVFHNDRDGAGVNDKLVESRLQNLPEGTLVLGSDHTCSNHGNELISVAVSAGIEPMFVANLYRCVLLLKMGMYWTRLLLSVEPCFEKSLKVVRIDADAEIPTCQYNEELCDYLKSNYHPRFRRRGRDITEEPEKNLRES